VGTFGFLRRRFRGRDHGLRFDVSKTVATQAESMSAIPILRRLGNTSDIRQIACRSQSSCFRMEQLTRVLGHLKVAARLVANLAKGKVLACPPFEHS
jgi:hypothetical protein